MTEYFFTCPHCWDKISMLIDTSISGQNYIEDCEICCNPIEINYTTLENEIAYFDAKSIDQ
ncbi:MAG: CPXCG motif-containing cysteine-rich protein [Crocinitomicaceae bacterium]|nr:CPXCG motif-containing cysteine-rich protein [Crocinitomicaceae bacterium]|tara:strand:- start:1130 stop:1312 length:183 start_codon:yes stop_codon:yes gene_type:complete